MQYDEYITSRLNEKELQVADLAAKGLTNQEIADSIFFSLYYVKYHLSNVFEKLGAKNRNNLAFIMGSHIINNDTKV